MAKWRLRGGAVCINPELVSWLQRLFLKATDNEMEAGGNMVYFSQ